MLRSAAIAVASIVVTACGTQRPVAGFPRPIPVTLMHGVCDTIGNTHRCADAIEARQLARLGALGSRDARGICLRLAGGSDACVPHDTSGSWPSWYAYLGTIADPPYHVLWRQYHEGNGVLLVNARTGRLVSVDDLPVPSPDAAYLAVASLDLEAMYNPNRVSVYRAAGDSLILEWALEPDGWGPGEPVWSGARLLVPRVEIQRDAGYREIVTDTIVVERRGTSWTVIRGQTGMRGSAGD